MAKLKDKDWKEYYKKMTLTPRKHVIQALKYFEKNPPIQKIAIDLGCGNGRDSLALLEKGWQVLAIDKTPEAVSLLRDTIPPEFQNQLTIQGESFENVTWKKANLINASASLPFCDKAHFESVWSQIKNAIVPGGIFAGNFFGINDSWQSRLQCLSKEQIDLMFEGFEFIEFSEEEFDEKSARGPMKHWHVFDILAKKKN